MSELISTRIPEDVANEIEKLAKRESMQKAILLRKIVRIGLRELELEHALDLYRDGKATLWRAAEIARLPLWEIMEHVKGRKIPVRYDTEDAKEDLRLAVGK